MSMNTIVRQRRKELGLTQEQLANRLGVSTPAVSKWEKGATYPDVTLLPALARLLRTDLNTLLCFHEEMSQKEIGLFVNQIAEIFRQEGVETAFVIAMEKVKEYPTHAALIYSIALVLKGSLMMAELPIEQKESYDVQIMALYEQVAQCDDSKYRDQANYMLASRLITTDAHDKAQKALDALPDQDALDKRNLQAQLWLKEGNYTEAAQLLEHKLLADIQEIQANLASLVNISIKEGDETTAMHLAKCGQNEVESFGLWRYSAFIVPLESALLRKDVAESISTLQTMLRALLIPWNMKKSPICKHIKPKSTEKHLGKQFLSSVLLELETSQGYDFLREEPAFQELIDQYRF